MAERDVADGHADGNGDDALSVGVSCALFAGHDVANGGMHRRDAASKLGIVLAAVVLASDGDFLEVFYQRDVIDNELVGLMQRLGGVGAATLNADTKSACLKPFGADDLLVAIGAGGDDVCALQRGLRGVTGQQFSSEGGALTTACSEIGGSSVSAGRSAKSGCWRSRWARSESSTATD